jgi:hypothetical protein
MSQSISLPVSALAFGVSAATALAGPVTVILTGEVAYPSALGGISAGNAASLSYTYDSSAAFTGAIGGFHIFDQSTLNSITIGAFTYGKNSANTNGNQYIYGSTLDTHRNAWYELQGPSQTEGSIEYFADSAQIELSGPGSVMSTTEFLPSAAQETLLTSASGSVQFWDAAFSNSVLVEFDWNNIQVIDNPAIPLPTGAAMAMVGMGVIGVRRRRS